MKKLALSLVLVILVTFLSGAAQAQSKTLVVYFSVPETDKAENMTREEDNSTVVIDGKVLGNTQYVAQVIQANVGADLFRIEPETPYTTNHADLIAFAREDQGKNARPRMKANVERLERYDTIFLGYPNWWGDLPMILYTFLETHDLAGKTVVPFVTHGGSGFSDTVRTIASLQPGAKVLGNGLSLHRDRVQDSDGAIVSWLRELGYVK